MKNVEEKSEIVNIRKEHALQQKKKAREKRELGVFGENVAEFLLCNAGFNKVKNLNREKMNTPYADIYAKRHCKSYVISVKTRHKYQLNGLLNPRYKLEHNCHDKAKVVSEQYGGAIPAWVTIAIDIDTDTLSAYFETLAFLGGNKGVCMKEEATKEYECLAKDIRIDTAKIDKDDYNKLKIARNIEKGGE